MREKKDLLDIKIEEINARILEVKDKLEKDTMKREKDMAQLPNMKKLISEKSLHLEKMKSNLEKHKAEEMKANEEIDALSNKQRKIDNKLAEL